jgi:hypothetical protein
LCRSYDNALKQLAKQKMLKIQIFEKIYGAAVNIDQAVRQGCGRVTLMLNLYNAASM